MSVFDLKPLSAKTIDDLKIGPDQLWEIKIDENIYGPFETLQLKHYSQENRSVMARAYVSNMSVDNWRSFFEVRDFHADSQYSGPYWMLAQGQKSSPLSKSEIAKRIELGTITRHDEISEDDGRHWHRISSHQEFENYFTTASTLPETPQESSFQKAKIRVLEQLEAKKEHVDEKESLAGLTHASLVSKEKTKTVKIEDIKLSPEKSQGSFWEHHRVQILWATPVLAMIVYFMYLKPAPVAEVAEVSESVEKTQKPSPKRSKKDSWSRTPANYEESSYDRSGVTQQPTMDDGYPTVIETHQEDQSQNYPDPSAESDQLAEIQDQENRENSLLDQQPNRDPAQDNGESLDATMNNETMEMPNPAVDQPVVEEVSDF
jgi:hypothetical protein